MSQSNTAEVLVEREAGRALVLIVDDEAPIGTSLSNVLKDEGFETLLAEDGDQAIQMVAKFQPELVFLDMWMPGRDGMETLNQIKAVSPDTEVVMISGHATITNALDALKAGAFDFIEKPFEIETLIATAVRALRKRDKERESRADENSATALSRKQGVLETFSHPGMLTKGLAGKNLGQRTIRGSIILYGQCLHSGVKSGLVLEPLPKDSGLHFAKVGGSKSVPVFVDYVESTNLATTVRSGDTSAATIEHLMAALHAYGISNLLIKCNGEVPIFDGSSKQFCDAIEAVGIEEQGGDWFEIKVDKEYHFEVPGGKGESISISPAETFSVTYELDYPAPVGKHVVHFNLENTEAFKQDIAPARTFGFLRDIERLQRAGLAAGGRLDNFILIGPDGVVNTALRFDDELARHKVLDSIGDLFLIGRPICGHVKARMTGHSDNISLLRLITPHIGA